jgi:hypothetical protein
MTPEEDEYLTISAKLATHSKHFSLKNHNLPQPQFNLTRKMKNSILCKISLGALLISAFPTVVHAGGIVPGPPGIINHQGRVTVEGVNFDGYGGFKFSLVNSSGNITYWSHDGSGAGGAEPTAEVPIPVAKGLFSVGLGDTDVTGMTQSIPSNIFADSDQVYLRIWFRAGGAGPAQQLPFSLLSPDQRITSAAYALHARSVDAALIDHGGLEATSP